MKKLVFLLLVAAAAWYGWKHYPELLERKGSHDLVIENASGRPMERIRIMVDGQTLVKEALGENQTATIPFRVQNDATFRMEWEYATQLGTRNWAGGMVPKGPMLQRHFLTVDHDDAVMYRAENKVGS